MLTAVQRAVLNRDSSVTVKVALVHQEAMPFKPYVYGASDPKLRPEVPEGE